MVDNFSVDSNGKVQKHFVHEMLLFELPKLTRTSINGNRFYSTPDGNKYPSITTVVGFHTRQSIMAWRRKVGEEEANRISRESANRGTKIHTICEDYLNNKPDYADGHEEEHVSMFNQFQDAVDRINNIKCQETSMYSDKLAVAGTVDCIAEFDGKLSIIDFKTKRKEMRKEWTDSHFMQCAGYGQMWEQHTNIPIEQLVVLITTATGVCQVFVEDKDSYNNQRVPQLQNLIDEFNKANFY
jgi:genome maintenance exonuclease 1